jgi:anti-sigma factor RsiW
MRFWRRRRRAIVCREAVALMADYLDGRIAHGDRVRLEAHLAQCPHCSEYLAQIRATIDALGRADPETLGDDALDELVVLYRRWQADGPQNPP